MAEAPVSFRADIAPLLHRRCETCHNEDSAKGRYRLDTFLRLGKAGESDLPPIVPGKPRESELFNLLNEPSANDRMPQKAAALPAAEIALVERWISEGAAYDGGEPERPLAEMARAALLRPAPDHYVRPAPVTALAFSPDGNEIAVGGYFEVTIWNASDGTLVHRIGGLPERIASLAWHPKSGLLAVAGGSPAQWGGVALVDPAAGWQVRYLCDLPDTALSVAFSPGGETIAAGGADRSVRFFETASGRQTRILRQHADWVQSVAFSPDGKRLVSASRDRTARVFLVATGDMEATYGGHESALLGAVFSGNTTVCSHARGRAIHVWDAVNGSRFGEFAGIPTEVQEMAAGSFGLLTAGADGRVRVYQRGDRSERFCLRGHDDVVQALAVGPSGERFASGSADGVVCVWSLACGTWVQRFTAQP